MHSVMIVEDEVQILNHMQKMLSTFDDFQIKGAFLTPEEALAAFEDIQPDAVFLDIEMPRMNGIELARKMLEHQEDLHIIFTTAYGQYAINAFAVEALDYLMKPIMKEDVDRVIKRLNKTLKQRAPQKNRIKERSTFPVCCFGSFDVRDQQQQIVKWPTRKAEELFAYFLIHQGEYINKWELLDILWPDMEKERGLHNLYNTIYRIKPVLKNLPYSPRIRKINDGYMMEAGGPLSDLNHMVTTMKYEKTNENFTIERAAELFFSYRTPLFGKRDYLWSLPLQKYVVHTYEKLCRRLLGHYRKLDQFGEAEEIIRHYISHHIEDETMMYVWLKLLASWKDHEEKVGAYRAWFNEKLKEAELPPLT